MAIGSRRQAEITRLETALAALRTAISALETGGQSVTLDGMSYTQAAAPTLYSRQSELETRIERLRGFRPLSLSVDLSGVGQ